MYKSTKSKPYVYLCTHKKSGEFYIGYREYNTKLNRTSDVDFPIYQSSSKFVKNNFKDFEWVILAEFDSGKDAYEFEHILIYENWENPLLLNKHCCHNGLHFRRTSPPWNKGMDSPYKRTDETKRKIKEKRANQVMGVSPLKGKTLVDIHGDNANAVREKISKSMKLSSNTPESKQKKKNKMLELWKDESFKQSRSQSIKNGWDKGRDTRSGLNHTKADQTVYTFIHKSGIIEKCTRVEMKQKHKIGSISKLILGVIKTSMGWTVDRGDI